MAGRAEEAESMVLKLSTFLPLEPHARRDGGHQPRRGDRPQRLYLDIEKVRFPRRLKAEFDIPEELENAKTACLILQPIVENVIKHAVSQTRGQGRTQDCRARGRAGRFTIEVSNTNGRPRSRAMTKWPERGSASPMFAKGCRPLWPARRCDYGPTGDGGYSVLLDPAAGSIGMGKEALRVLIADDEPLAAERLQLLLAKCEASIWSARRPTATARLE